MFSNKVTHFLCGLIMSISMLNIALAQNPPVKYEFIVPEGNVKVIEFDMGGLVLKRELEVEFFRNNNTRVMIAGSCWSSCTLFLGLKNVCATRSASFHFHAPYKAQDGKRYYSPEKRKEFLGKLPSRLRSWIDINGGLGRDWLHLVGPDVFNFIRPCKPAEYKNLM